MNPTSSTPSRKRKPVIELLLLIGLPLAVLVAGAVTTMLATSHGFTPMPDAPKIINPR
ncbi:MAG: hypothetical protein PHP86_10005 [Nevskiales bacterium]|nr:hypothetical protein [Nevskiales bacterium]